MNNTLKKKISLSLLFSIIIFILISYYSYRTNLALVEASSNRSRVYESKIHMETLLGLLTAAETGERGYVITGDAVYLEPYYNALSKIDSEKIYLRKLTGTGELTAAQTEILETLIERRITELNNTISNRKIAGSEIALVNTLYTAKGKYLMDSIRNNITEIEKKENDLIYEYMTAVHKHQAEFGIFIPTATIFGILVIIMTSLVFNKGINARALSEKDLQLSEAKYRLEYNHSLDLYNNAPCGYHLLNKDGLIVEINDTELSWLGYTRDEVVNKIKLSDILDSDEMKLKFLENFKNIIETGTASDLEFVITRKDGSTFPISLSAASKYDSAGNFLQSRTTMFDITERKKSEIALQLSKDQYERLIENIKEVLITDDINGNVTFANAQFTKMFELSGKEFPVLKIEDYVAESFRSQLREGHDRRIRGEKVPDQIEFQGITKSGKLIWLEASVSTRIENGKITGTQSAIRNITERKVAEDKIGRMNEELEQKVFVRTKQLSESNKELESFSYSVSHDLRSPLRHIIGFGEKLQRVAAGHLNVEDQRLISKMTSSAEKMAKLIDDLLQLSRVGRTELDKSTINLNTIVDEIISEYKDSEENTKIEWIVKQLPEIHADPVLLRVVMTNLISNAVKYTGKKEKRIIEIGQLTERNESVFYVKDNGAGFDMRYSSKLFGVFQRLHSENEYEGTGIGLAIVSRIISRHGGRVWAEGETDKGAIVNFTLPINYN